MLPLLAYRLSDALYDFSLTAELELERIIAIFSGTSSVVDLKESLHAAV